MSIVERAIRKMQGSARASQPAARPPAPQQQVFGTVVEALPSAPSRHIAINQHALRGAGLLPPEHQARQISNQYRQIKRPLVANAIGRGVPRLASGQLIMVASAMPGEGKTFTSLNLAFSMALEKDVHVLLVDADVAKPHVSKMLGVLDEPGLLDALSDPSLDIEPMILGTDVPNLAVLPAGRRDEHATELLASDRMQQLAQALIRRDPSRLVVLDSPPLLLTTESRAIADVAGQIVVVVRADGTPQQTLLDALSYLDESSNIFLILNQSVAQSDAGYYYHYGYNSERRDGESRA